VLLDATDQELASQAASCRCPSRRKSASAGRKARLAKLLAGAPSAIQYSDHQTGRGPAFHRLACERVSVSSRFIAMRYAGKCDNFVNKRQ
jgi:hypothetical protein